MRTNGREKKDGEGGQDTGNEDRKEAGAFYMYIQGRVNIMKCNPTQSSLPISLPFF